MNKKIHHFASVCATIGVVVFGQMALAAPVQAVLPPTGSAAERRMYPGGRDDSDLTVQPIRKQNTATVINDDHSNDFNAAPAADLDSEAGQQ